MPDNQITMLLGEIGRGVDDAPSRLMDAVYDELRTLAAAKMNRERSGHTLQPTALVHEAFLRLVGSQAEFTSRAHFFGAAARAMERVLVDHARARGAQKRGGRVERVTLADVSSAESANSLDVIELREVVEMLERESPELAMLVRYRYFLGLTLADTAMLMDIPLATLKRRWAYARAWLYAQMATNADEDIEPVPDAHE